MQDQALVSFFTAEMGDHPMSIQPTAETPRPILLTGASGVVGAALLHDLLDVPVICLTHRTPLPGDSHREEVKGDLTAPLLGLDLQTYQTLSSRIGAVIHAAAVTDFDVGTDVTEKLNVRGTQQVLDLAGRAEVPLHYISTAFVARAQLTRSTRTDSDAGPRMAASPDDYLDSKRVAEQLLRDSGQPHTILRPSVVLGDSRTGQTTRFQGSHGIAGAVLKNALPLVPLDPIARVDFVPRDLVARAVAGVVRAGAGSGEYWITAGEQALTAGRMVELAVELANDLGLQVQRPRLVNPDMVDRLLRPVFIDPLPDRVRRRFDDLMSMAALFCTPDPFESSLAALPGIEPITASELERSFSTSLRYYARVQSLAPGEEAA